MLSLGEPLPCLDGRDLAIRQSRHSLSPYEAKQRSRSEARGAEKTEAETTEVWKCNEDVDPGSLVTWHQPRGAQVPKCKDDKAFIMATFTTGLETKRSASWTSMARSPALRGSGEIIRSAPRGQGRHRQLPRGYAFRPLAQAAFLRTLFQNRGRLRSSLPAKNGTSQCC